MTTHIILPTTGPQSMLRDMLASLAAYTDPCHLVTILNTKEDWRRAAIRPLLDCLIDNGWRTTLIEVPEQIGYVRACNLGWRACQDEAKVHDTVVVLNDDLVFTGRWLELLEENLKMPGTLQVGPSLKTVGPDGLWGGPSDPPYIEGWCFAIKVLSASYPFFSPEFEPQFCEDMDLSLRIIDVLADGRLDLARQRIRQIDIPVEHLRSATVGLGEAREPYWTENRRKLVEKWTLDKVERRHKLFGTESPPPVLVPTHTVSEAPPLIVTSSGSLPSLAAKQGWDYIV